MWWEIDTIRYEYMRDDYLASLSDQRMATLFDAREKMLRMAPYTPIKPTFIGTRVIAPSLSTLIPYIDWTPFFQVEIWFWIYLVFNKLKVWQLRGKYPYRGYPKLFDDPTIGAQAQELFGDAQRCLNDIVTNERLQARGIIGFI
jgi:5-methyltetrahydrofolate--homocysteine methyltransferase